MADSKIEWTDKTWNPVRGCQLVSPGCSNCYAMKFAHRFSGKGKPYEGLTKLGGKGPMWTGIARPAPEMLDQPLRWKKPARVFVNSMSDLFHEDIPSEYIAAVFGVMAACPQHTFQILTKRAARLPEWFAWMDRSRAKLLGDDGKTPTPCDWRVHAVAQTAHLFTAYGGPIGPLPEAWPLPNVWLGVSVENQEQADLRIPHLLKVPAAVRFLSCEPLLGPVTLDQGPGEFLRCAACGYTKRDVAEQMDHSLCKGSGPGISWVIVGGESGHGARPLELSWARSIVAQCKAASVPVFVKQLGALAMGVGADVDAILSARGRSDGGGCPPGPWRLPLTKKGGDMTEWPADLRVREFPPFPVVVQ